MSSRIATLPNLSLGRNTDHPQLVEMPRRIACKHGAFGILDINRQRISRSWALGRTIRSLAAEYRLPVAVVEAVLWESYNSRTPRVA